MSPLAQAGLKFALVYVLAAVALGLENVYLVLGAGAYLGLCARELWHALEASAATTSRPDRRLANRVMRAVRQHQHHQQQVAQRTVRTPSAAGGGA